MRAQCLKQVPILFFVDAKFAFVRKPIPSISSCGLAFLFAPLQPALPFGSSTVLRGASSLIYTILYCGKRALSDILYFAFNALA